MVADDRWAESLGPGAATFATTHWTVVLAAQAAPSPHAALALEKLCCAYWYPLYAYTRRHGASPEDAQDSTQAFFAHLLRKETEGYVVITFPRGFKTTAA